MAGSVRIGLLSRAMTQVNQAHKPGRVLVLGKLELEKSVRQLEIQ